MSYQTLTPPAPRPAPPSRDGALPNVVIAGAPKCGTTALYAWLNDHPDVFGSPRKELQFYMDRDSSVFRPASNVHDHGVDGYRAHFQGYAGDERVVLEATPGYLYQSTAVERMPVDLPETHFVFVLREPAARFLSTYSFFQQNRAELDGDVGLRAFLGLVDAGDERLAWNEFLRDARQHGRYLEYLERWVERAGEDRVVILLYEDLKRDPLAFTRGLCSRIGIDPSFYDHYTFGQHNATYQVQNWAVHELATRVRGWIPQSGIRDVIRSLYRRANTTSGRPPMDESDAQVIEELRAFYAPSNDALADRFGLDLRSWSRT